VEKAQWKTPEDVKNAHPEPSILILGTASRVSEVMNGKRELSMSMIRKLRERFWP